MWHGDGKRTLLALIPVLVPVLLSGCEAPEVIPREDDRSSWAEQEKNIPEHEGDRRLSGLVSRASRVHVDGDVAALIEEADAMRDALEKRQPPVAIAIKLARMYESAGRYPDAIDWYRRVIDVARPALDAFDELRDAGVDEPADAPDSCRPSGPAGSFEAASVRAMALEEEDRALAFACYRAALAPIAEAKRRRGESWLALDGYFLALRHIERALVITPDEPELLLLLGVISFEIEPWLLGPHRAVTAKEAWRRYLALAPDGPIARQIREALPHIELLIEHGQFDQPRH